MGCGSVSVWERPAPAAAKGLAAQGVKCFASRLPQVLLLPASSLCLRAGGGAQGLRALRIDYDQDYDDDDDQDLEPPNT